MTNVVLHRRFVMTNNVTSNNNKYWYVTVYDNGNWKTEWGRVGATPSISEFNEGHKESAIRKANSKANSKVRKGYQEVEVVGTGTAEIQATSNVHSAAMSQVNTSDKDSKDVLQLMVRTNKHQILSSTSLSFDEDTGLFQTPVGVVSQNSIDEARKLLKEISKYVDANKWSDPEGNKLLAQYMMKVPLDVGRRTPTLQNVLYEDRAIEKQEDILDGLEGSLRAIATTPKKSANKVEEKVFDVSMSLVENGKEIDRITKLYTQSLNKTHMAASYKPHRIFEIKIAKMIEAFEKKIASMKDSNLMQLWHGTNVGNLLSILSVGLIIPKNASHGRMFGNGVYFSDQSTKALNYAAGYWSGSRNNHCFMFLADVAMGKMFTPDNYRMQKPRGYDSTFAKAGKSGVMNNEMIVYNTNQCNIAHLIEFKR